MPRYCVKEGCNKQSSFGKIIDKIPTHCKNHAEIDMIDVKKKCCNIKNCNIRPTFGKMDDSSPTRCKKHAEIDMINIVSKRCTIDNCDKRPSFGKLGDKTATRCKKHAETDMVDISSKNCIIDNCNKQPTFGDRNNKIPTHCRQHAEFDMIDVRSKRCELCNLIQVNPKYKPHCASCHFYLNPDDPRIINYKTKEQAYMNKLLELYPDLQLDKIINGGCSKRRPDGFLDLLTHVLIIEIDENEHKSYDNECNNKRIMELSQDVNHRPIVFIRLNPDGYTLNGKRMKGSFSVTKKTGELKMNKLEFNKRLDSLIECIEKNINNIPIKTINIEYLYFSD